MTEHTQKTENIAVIFLCKRVTRQIADFANKVARESNYKPFIVVDEWESANNFMPGDLFTIVTVSDEDCKKYGYVGCNITGKETHIKKDVIAWDKMLAFFCQREKQIDFAWIFEDDVFIPSVDTIKRLTEKYSNTDLVVPNNFHKAYNANDWHWPNIVDKIGPPYFHSMVSACGMSQKMFGEVKKFVDEKHTLFHIEAMFNTLAMQNRSLSVSDIFEFKSVVWQGFWGIDEFLLLPNNVFHPVKQLTSEDLHEDLRKDIQQAKMQGYVPVNSLPEFINRLMTQNV